MPTHCESHDLQNIKWPAGFPTQVVCIRIAYVAIIFMVSSLIFPDIFTASITSEVALEPTLLAPSQPKNPINRHLPIDPNASLLTARSSILLNKWPIIHMHWRNSCHKGETCYLRSRKCIFIHIISRLLRLPWIQFSLLEIKNIVPQQ